VDSANPGTGLEICIAAASCQAGTAPNGLGGELHDPEGVAANPAGDLYVADLVNNRIQKFVDPPAQPSPTPLLPSTPAGLAAPSNQFDIGKLKGRTLVLNLGSLGEVKISDAAAGGAGAAAGANGSRAFAAAKKRLLKPSSVRGGPGRVTVKLRLTKVAQTFFRQKGKVKLRARITFTPDRGTANSRVVKLKVKKKKK